MNMLEIVVFIISIGVFLSFWLVALYSVLYTLFELIKSIIRRLKKQKPITAFLYTAMAVVVLIALLGVAGSLVGNIELSLS